MDIDEKRESYRRLFLTEAGGLKPDAVVVLEDLLDFAAFFTDRKMPGDGTALAILEGSRATVRHILKKSGAGGQILQRLLKGDNHE